MPDHVELLAGIKRMTVRPTDVWLCGYRKSGNTWLSEIVSLVMADGVVDRVLGRPIGERVPSFFQNNLSKPVLQYFHELADPRIIYIVRNPKDCCLSAFRFHHNMKLLAIDWHDFYQLFLDGDVLNGDWFQHLNDFWLTYGSNHANVLFVAYEELRADLPAMVCTIARFLGKQFTDETVTAIVTHCTADAMRDNPMANRSDMKQALNLKANFVGNATVGDGRRHMSVEESALFDETYGHRLRAIRLRLCDDMADAQRCMRNTGRIIARQ
ncbi:unnamed protein product [Medioppia subpectinata]|uniref:Sulfotransferase domain-containing protein n=1 Tax=Medioppia subpectinata TaxID=1979941 RepID=A0A7R9PYK5_9ACAR|nr:unnamed protein product [Medioppia subpectinata]CAG2106177.1 unnamed protein product [Medioppia subpectinata]